MRTLRDPLTIAAIAFTVVSTIASASAAKAEADDEAALRTAEAQQERVSRARELRDEAKAREARLSRTRALLVAGGGGTTVGTGLALLTDQRAEALTAEQRLLSDSITRENFLLARAANAKSRGRAAFTNIILRSVGGNLTKAAFIKAGKTP